MEKLTMSNFDTTTNKIEVPQGATLTFHSSYGNLIVAIETETETTAYTIEGVTVPEFDRESIDFAKYDGDFD